MRTNKIAVTLLSALCMAVFTQTVTAQDRTITLEEAVSLGIANSKALKMSQNKIDQAVSQYNQAKDGSLPTGKASFMYSHAEIPAHTLQLGGGKPIELPKRADAFVGTASIQEVIFGGGKLKYAKQSTELLTHVAQLDADLNKEDVAYSIVEAYYGLYRVLESEKVVAQNLQAIDKQLKQAERFFEQGIVTKNDVLRFQLQKSNIQLTNLDLENNRKVINYNLNVLLGLPEATELRTSGLKTEGFQVSMLNNYIDSAMTNRQEFKQYDIRSKVADNNIKSVKANLYPTLGVGADLYYINPSGSFIPPTNQYIVPITLGATLSWNFGSLWNNKNKVAEARIKKQETVIGKEITTDKVKTEVNKSYQGYMMAVEKIKVIETAITQATENDKILESKYKNNVASAIDRIDAETLLFQAKINLELAKADAGLAYYTLLKSTGKLNK